MMCSRIAIVGCGPKGFYAFDALCEAARSTPTRKLKVHIFEPCAHPGAGPIYDPDQPDVLLMNFPAGMIDVWTGGRGPDLLAWTRAQGGAVAANAYVPRAMVGRYLSRCFERRVANAPPNIDIKVHNSRVETLRRVPEGWRVATDFPVFDEVLVATGHQDWTREMQARDHWTIPSPFPIDRALAMAAVPPGASVACRGFALTFLDTMLALTEGRGGVFTKDDTRYLYQPSGNEPRLIAPFSRTGRPMRAKVEPDRFKPPQGDNFWRTYINAFDAMLAAKPEAKFYENVWPELLRIADRTLDKAPGTAATFFADWQASAFDAGRSRRDLRKGYAIATGTTPRDIGWALAEAWRRCYPRLVRWISHRDLSAPDAARFRLVAAEMERLAFGPPAQNVGKLICLEKAGLVSLDHLTGDPAADITLDANIPPPGSAALAPPLSGLLRAGYLSTNALGGIAVNDRAQALVAGAAVPGLSIIGRATEGSVLGNDTLSRTLHSLPERWASRVVSAAPSRGTLEHSA